MYFGGALGCKIVIWHKTGPKQFQINIYYIKANPSFVLVFKERWAKQIKYWPVSYALHERDV